MTSKVIYKSLKKNAFDCLKEYEPELKKKFFLNYVCSNVPKDLFLFTSKFFIEKLIKNLSEEYCLEKSEFFISLPLQNLNYIFFRLLLNFFYNVPSFSFL